MSLQCLHRSARLFESNSPIDIEWKGHLNVIVNLKFFLEVRDVILFDTFGHGVSTSSLRHLERLQK